MADCKQFKISTIEGKGFSSIDGEMVNSTRPSFVGAGLSESVFLFRCLCAGLLEIF